MSAAVKVGLLGASNNKGRPTKIMNLKKLNIHWMYLIFLNNLNYIEYEKSDFFHLNIHFAGHFATTWTLLPRAATPLAPP